MHACILFLDSDTWLVSNDVGTSSYDMGLFITDYDSHNLEWKQND